MSSFDSLMPPASLDGDHDLCPPLPKLQFTAWHPLLVRTLRTFLEENTQGFRVASLLAILSRIPVPQESSVAIEGVLPALRSFILNCSLYDVLSHTGDVTKYVQFKEAVELLEKDISMPIAHKKQKRSPQKKRRRSKNRRSLVGGKELGDVDSDSDRAVYPGPKMVHIHECILLSDSDGFAAFAGDIPPAGNDVSRDKIDDNSIYVMYRSLFGTFPTLIGPFDTIIYALMVHTKFSVKSSLPAGIKLLCDFLSTKRGTVSLEEDAYVSPEVFRQWISWQAVVNQTTRLAASLARLLVNVVGCDVDSQLEKTSALIMTHLRKNIDTSVRLSLFVRSPDCSDDVPLAVVDDTVWATSQVSLGLFDTLLSLIAISSDKKYLSALGAAMVAWSSDGAFAMMLPTLLTSIENRLDIYRGEPSEETRFAFELFASLVDNSQPDVWLDWCLSLPSGFHKSVTGLELLSALSSQIVSNARICAKILRRHLPVMPWSSPSQHPSSTPVVTFTGISSASLPYTSSGTLMPSASATMTPSSSASSSSTPPTQASRVVIRLANSLREYGTKDSLLLICTIVLPYCDPYDCEFILLETVIPGIVEICEKNGYNKGDVDGIMSTNAMTSDMKVLLKELELLAAYLKTKDAAEEVLRSIVVPYREFYFSAFELQDVFVAVCAKAVRLAPLVAASTGLCEWMADRLSACLRHASVDIWIFMDDSAATFSKLLLSMLNIVNDVLEMNHDVFSSLSDRLLSYTSSLVDVCFEWMSSPSSEYRSISRLSEIMSKALSVHLLLSSDSMDVNQRFTAAILRSLNKDTPSQLFSCIVCSLLDRCVSRLPPSLGSLMSIDEQSEDDALMGEGGPLASAPSRVVLHPQLVVSVLDICCVVLRQRVRNNNSERDETIEFMIIKLAKRLLIVDKHCQGGAQWLPQLFSLCDVLMSLHVSMHTLASILSLITDFVKRHPNSRYLHTIMQFYHKSDDYKEVFLSSISSLISDSPLEPSICLLFPQSAVNQPKELRTADDAFAEARKILSEEMEKNGSSNTLLGAVEKLLSSYRSDGETENERRREKKKHLRDQVRGSSMVSMDNFASNRGGPLSPPLAIANGSAASFTLGETHEISATDGLSLSFWIKRRMNTNMATRENPLHVVSLGGEDLLAVLWMNSRGKLLVDVTVGDIKLARVRLRGRAKENEWTHIVFGIRISSTVVTVQGTVHEGSTCREVPLLVHLRQLSFPITVSFGCVRRRSHHHFSMSSMFGFKGLLASSCVMVLAALGCQLSSLSETKLDQLAPNLASIVTYHLVSVRQHTLEAVRHDVAKYLQKVQRAVVFVIRSGTADSYGVSVLPADVEPSALMGQSPLSLAFLKDYPIKWHGRLSQKVNPSIDEALATIGGLKLIIYIYVKSVNDSLAPSTQRLALDLVLRCLRRGPAYCAEASRLKTNQVLTRTLSSPLAAMDDHVMDLLARHCIDFSPVEEADVDSSQDGSAEKMAPRLDPNQAVIRDAHLLVSLLCRAELWRGARFRVWRRFIAVIASIVDPSICRASHKYNRSQLVAVDMMPKLLHCLLEMIQDPGSFDDFSLEDVFVSDVVSIVQSLLGSPESALTVTHLWHFVFLSHPASFTYIDHRVQGHSEWIAPEFIRDEGEGELLGDSKLCKTLKRYIHVLGKDAISESWQKGSSPYEIRRAFEEAVASTDDTGGSSDPLAGSSGHIQASMPDLISDCMAADSATALSSGGSSSDIPIYMAGTAGDTTSLSTSIGKGSEYKWVVALRAGLMNVIAAVLQNGADSLLACLQHDVISWHAIVVLMSHQSDTRVRDAAVDMLQKFLLRCPPYTKIAFLRLSGFQMLASQLKSRPISPAMADHLFSMMCGETIRLGDGLDQSHLAFMPVDRISCESLNAIFVAFEESVADAPLFWNITNALMKTFENNSQLQQAMVDHRLVDAMVNSLRRIALLEPDDSRCEVVTGAASSASLQLEGWSSFAQRIIISSIPYNDPRLNAACQRFVWLLILADIQATRDSKWTAEQRIRGHRVIRGQLCQLLHCWMESIRTVFSEEGRSASTTSSVDSLYNPTGSVSSSPSDEYDYCDDVITPERATLLEGTSPVAAFLAGSFANLREKISHMGPISRRTLRCSYVRRPGPAPLAAMDALTERLIFALDANATVFSVLTPSERVTDEEENLFHFHLYFMLSSWKKEQSPRSAPQSVWQRLVVLCRDRVRVLLAQTVAFILFPAHKKMHQAAVTTRTDVVPLPNWESDWVEEKRRQIVKALAHELQYKQSLSTLLSVNLDYEYALCLGLYELAFISPMKAEFEEEIDRMIRFLNSCRVGSNFDHFTSDSLSNLTTDEILSMHSYSQHRKGVMAQLRSKMETIRDEEAKLTALVSEMAMAVTCEVVEEQNLPRKVFIRATKTAIGEFVEAENTLLSIAKELCHPEAAGFEARHWPVGWALDPTEGPMRERRRMMPYYYPFESRFFCEDRQSEVTRNIEEPPLQQLLRGPISSRSVLESAQIDSAIRLLLDVTVLRGTFECQGELLVAEDRLHFVGDKARSSQKGTECSVISLSWRFDQLIEIQSRNHLLKDLALEMFTANGDTYLIVFQNAQKRSLFKCQLVDCGLAHLFPSTDQMVHAVVQAWRHGTMSNFEYLMQLNKLAGRSFNDLMQYPVFPFVLADYTSSVLDLSNPQSFRNLAKPMAVQDKRMEAHYVANYNCLQAECARTSSDSGPLHFGPYHYGSHYSNSGIVVHYLVRLSPFTQIALEYQDNNFDIPDRLFNSIEATWRLSSSESTTDFKELIPEFFCLPEFLTNRDHLDLGLRQAGERVGSVRLPAWTPKGNARLFVLIHRQALEASTVSQNLHSWVDLIFGFKQTGKAALDALNVFHPATYLGHLNADELADELSQSALKTMVRSYGQMPIQVLQTPHQPHLSAGKEKRDRPRAPAPLGSISGIRWGDYVGSPEQDAEQIQVVLSVKGQKTDRLGRVICLPDGSAAGIPRSTLVIANSQPENPKDPLCRSRSVSALAALSWSFPDGILRFRNIKPELQPWIGLLDLGTNEIAAIEYSPTNNLLLVAFHSGRIQVLRLEFGVEGIVSFAVVCELLAHSSSISCLAVCEQFGIAVSGDTEGKVVMWDTNRLSFVRLLRGASSAVSSVCISATSGDVAVVCQQGYGSLVQLYTINGDLIGSVSTETTVVCVAMTNQKEGTAINCLALGMQDGHIRLVEMWCLTVVRDIWHESYCEPVVDVAFCHQSRRLFCVLSSGRVLCWASSATLSHSNSSASVSSNSSKSTRVPNFSIINPHEMSQ